METAPRKRGRPRTVKVEKRSPEPEDLEAILQDIDDEAIEDYDYIPNGVADYEVIKNKKNINNNEDVYDFDVEKEDGPGIIKAEITPEPETLEHACDICPRTFKTLPGLKRHKTSHDRKPQETPVVNDDSMKKEMNSCDCCGEDLATAHTIGDFECYDCGNFFKLKVNMERHQLMVHCYDDVLNCPTCEFSCTDKETLSQHLYSHAGTLKPYSCPVCFTSFSRKYHLVRHNMQTGCDGSEKPKFPCQVCGKVFNRKDNLREHLRAHAGQTKKKRTYNCEYCNKEFVGSALLTVHRRSHLGYRPYQCDLCPKRFPSSGAMKKHRRIHTGERPYECQQCFAKFAAKETLNRHIKTHTALKPHSCEFCGKTFIQISQLRAHLFHHTGENGFTCDICGKSFNRRSRLTLHTRYVHEGAEPFMCTVCNKALLRKEDVQRHHIVHSGVKAHACPICEKRFAMKSSLKIHLLTHTKEPPRACDECGRAFIRQDCLLRHMRSKHRDMLAEIMADAEKKKLEAQLLGVVKKDNDNQNITDEIDNNREDDDESIDELEDNGSITSEESNQNNTLAESLMELLTVLVDESTLKEFGWPGTTVDHLIESVIKRCGHTPVAAEEASYMARLRDNSKQLFSIIIDDSAIQTLLSNQTIEEVIEHVLKLAKA
ncbi:zinc finger protein ZFP2-like [Rhopalosiphum padi]|uniref:zinc finger protein ZFP2-like n=1 Tax=Rhopalosiphum padi TaxID=40932 RepID=UPI00298E0188|nr:zinc finger protein ZFP2-like [Rhopalosiphum padi]XP_060836198.1 zinc finger protein ZFP2-like [Rhopalosiphum padi]XP_060836199.1 zinc finger protein ZFP2-like [Rhopalosiphum padi]XP_060836200.1 zinc finger protein ZFP2-like [Rhopalosiphum padi]